MADYKLKLILADSRIRGINIPEPTILGYSIRQSTGFYRGLFGRGLFGRGLFGRGLFGRGLFGRGLFGRESLIGELDLILKFHLVNHNAA
jgi:hypothetical protein